MAKVDGTGAGRLVGSGQERSEGFATGGPKIKGEGRSGGGCGQRQVLLQPALPTPPPTPPPQMTPQHRHCRRHYHHPTAGGMKAGEKGSPIGRGGEWALGRIRQPPPLPSNPGHKSWRAGHACTACHAPVCPRRRRRFTACQSKPTSPRLSSVVSP